MAIPAPGDPIQMTDWDHTCTLTPRDVWITMLAGANSAIQASENLGELNLLIELLGPRLGFGTLNASTFPQDMDNRGDPGTAIDHQDFWIYQLALANSRVNYTEWIEILDEQAPNVQIVPGFTPVGVPITFCDFISVSSSSSSSSSTSVSVSVSVSSSSSSSTTPLPDPLGIECGQFFYSTYDCEAGTLSPADPLEGEKECLDTTPTGLWFFMGFDIATNACYYRYWDTIRINCLTNPAGCDSWLPVAPVVLPPLIDDIPFLCPCTLEDVSSSSSSTSVSSSVSVSSSSSSSSTSVSISSSSSSAVPTCEPNDSNTVLHLHMDGADGSTVFIDESLGAHIVTANGNAQIDTAQAFFGGSSGLFNGTTDFLTIPDSDDWTFNGDFTIDVRVYMLKVPNGGPPSGTTLIEQFIDANNYWTFIVWDDFRLYFQMVNGGVLTNIFSPIISWLINKWYHLAVTKSGNNYRLFIDGVLQVTVTDTTAPLNLSAQVKIGHGDYLNRYLDGYMDELRVVKGAAAWTAAFTPPALPYCDVVSSSSVSSSSSSTSVSSSSSSTSVSISSSSSTSFSVSLSSSSSSSMGLEFEFDICPECSDPAWDIGGGVIIYPEPPEDGYYPDFSLVTQFATFEEACLECGTNDVFRIEYESTFFFGCTADWSALILWYYNKVLFPTGGTRPCRTRGFLANDPFINPPPIIGPVFSGETGGLLVEKKRRTGANRWDFCGTMVGIAPDPPITALSCLPSSSSSTSSSSVSVSSSSVSVSLSSSSSSVSSSVECCTVSLPHPMVLSLGFLTAPFCRQYSLGDTILTYTADRAPYGLITGRPGWISDSPGDDGAPAILYDDGFLQASPGGIVGWVLVWNQPLDGSSGLFFPQQLVNLVDGCDGISFMEHLDAKTDLFVTATCACTSISSSSSVSCDPDCPNLLPPPVAGPNCLANFIPQLFGNAGIVEPIQLGNMFQKEKRAKEKCCDEDNPGGKLFKLNIGGLDYFACDKAVFQAINFFVKPQFTECCSLQGWLPAVIGGNAVGRRCFFSDVCPPTPSISSSSSAVPSCEPNDPNVVLHLHMDGPDLSPTFIDSSPDPHIITVVGSANITTAESMFGGAAGLFNGTTDYLKITDNIADFQFGTSIDFTIETWGRITDLGVINPFFSPQFNDPLNYIDGYWDPVQGLVFRSNLSLFNVAFTPAINTWVHYRFAVAGGIGYIFADGVLLGSQAMSGSFSVVGGFLVGRLREDTSFYFNGEMDEFRVINGTGLINPFTPATLPYCDLPAAGASGFLVSGAGHTPANGLYCPDLIVNGKQSYKHDITMSSYIYWEPSAGGFWNIHANTAATSGFTWYFDLLGTDGATPPLTGWSADNGVVVGPAPILSPATCGPSSSSSSSTSLIPVEFAEPCCDFINVPVPDCIEEIKCLPLECVQKYTYVVPCPGSPGPVTIVNGPDCVVLDRSENKWKWDGNESGSDCVFNITVTSDAATPCPPGGDCNDATFTVPGPPNAKTLDTCECDPDPSSGIPLSCDDDICKPTLFEETPTEDNWTVVKLVIVFDSLDDACASCGLTSVTKWVMTGFGTVNPDPVFYTCGTLTKDPPVSVIYKHHGRNKENSNSKCLLTFSSHGHAPRLSIDSVGIPRCGSLKTISLQYGVIGAGIPCRISLVIPCIDSSVPTCTPETPTDVCMQKYTSTFTCGGGFGSVSEDGLPVCVDPAVVNTTWTPAPVDNSPTNCILTIYVPADVATPCVTDSECQ